jgi:predicted dehydrogenase
MQRVAVIGAGKIGRTHAEAYAAIPNAELVAICDSRTDVAEEMAKEFSAKAVADVDQLLKEVEVDAIDVCTPTPAHLDVIKAAAAAGKHIACEKPLARTISQAMEADRICEEAGVTLFVAHVVRWFPEYRKLKSLIESGAIGETVEVRASRQSKAPLRPGNWLTNVQTSGGVVLDLVIHEFDWLRSVYGNVRRVYAKGLYNSHIPDADYALVTLRFENGVIAHIEGSWQKPSGFTMDMEIAGTEGLLEFRSDSSSALVIETKGTDAQPGQLVYQNCESVNPYQLELQHFIDCLETGKTPDVTGKDGIESVRIAEAALRSITTGEPVTLA